MDNEEIRGNGHNQGQEVTPLAETGFNRPPEIATINPDLHDPGFIVGASMDTGNPGSRILAMDKDLPTMLKSLDVDDDDEALDYAAALAWCMRWNRRETKQRNSRGTLDHHIEALKYRLALKCSRKAKYTHLYGEFANGLLTTDTNGRSLQHVIAKDKDKDKENGNHKLFGKV